MLRKTGRRAAAGLWAAAFLGCALAPAAAFAAPASDAPGVTSSIVFSDEGISASNETGISIEGTSLRISAPGRYEVSGECADGSIEVAKGTKDVVVVLNGLDLSSASTAPVVCAKSSAVTIEVANGSENTLADAAINNDDEHPDNLDAENAVVKCKDGSQVVLCGTGTLRIEANGKNGIKSGATTEEDGEASLLIRDVTLDVQAPVNDGINAEQSLAIESGDVTIAALDDAVHCDLTLNVGAKGAQGPKIRVTKCEEGLEAAHLNVLSGDIDIASNDDCLNAANSDLGDYAFTMDISGGKIHAVSASGDGFDSNGALTISGGDVEVWTSNTADNQPLDADDRITLSGGVVLAAGGSSGMGMMSLDAQQAYVEFGGSGGQFPGGHPGTPPGDPGTRPSGMPSFEPGTRPSGMPSFEPGAEPSGMPSFEPGARPSGMPGMGGSTISIAQGTQFAISDADGNALCTGTTPCATGYVFYSSDALDSGATYVLSAGGEKIETKTAQIGSSSGRPGMPGLPAGVTMKPGSTIRVETVDGSTEITGYEARKANGPTVDDLEEQFEVLQDGITEGVYSAGGQEKDDEDVLATGDVLRFARGEETIFEGTVVVAGDVLGTGTLSLSQLVAMAIAYRGTKPLEGPYLAAGDFSGSGQIDLADLVREAALYSA